MRHLDRRATSFVALALVLLIGLAVGGCGGGTKKRSTAATATPKSAAQSGEAEKETAVAVTLSEWKITAPDGSAIGPLKAGEIKFDVHNGGTMTHELVVVKSDADPASFPVSDGKIDEDAAGTSPGEVDDIAPGQSKNATMRLTPANYVLLCNIPGHYQQGMRVRLVVQ